MRILFTILIKNGFFFDTRQDTESGFGGTFTTRLFQSTMLLILHNIIRIDSL